jgi:hypothetical protein
MAQATDYVYSRSFVADPAYLGFDPYMPASSYLQSLNDPPSFNLQAGDTISGTFTLANGGFALGGNLYWIGFDFFGKASADYTVTVNLHGLTGHFMASNHYHSPRFLGNEVLGATIGSLMDATQSYAFTGLDYTIHIADIQPHPPLTQTPVPFGFARIDIAADSVQLVPEPATWALSVAGAGVITWRRFKSNDRIGVGGRTS